jgi:hypothetical protein
MAPAMGAAVVLGEDDPGYVPFRLVRSARRARGKLRGMGEPARAREADRSARARHLSGAPSSYVLREGAETILDAAAGLRAFVEETCVELRKVFGVTAELAVTRYEDPDAPESAASLYVLVRTALDATSAGGLLDRFDDGWWLDNAPRAAGRVEVSLEFV